MSLVRVSESPMPSRSTIAAAFTLDQVWQMANYIYESKAFPVSNPQQAFALMMLAQADNLHPMHAMRRYHLMTMGGKTTPVMKADVMQAEFQADGGQVKMIERSNTRACAAFCHPVHQPQWVEMEFTMEDAIQGGVAGSNPNYKKWPASMLWARLMTNALTTLHPGIKNGIISEVEAQDIDYEASPPAVHARLKQDAIEAIRSEDIPLPGDPDQGIDSRPYHAVAKFIGETIGLEVRKVHDYVWNAAVQHDQPETRGDRPTSLSGAVKTLTALYQRDRQFVRSRLDDLKAWAEKRDEAESETESVEVEPGANG